MNRIERAPMYLLGQLDALIPTEEAGRWPTFRQAFIEMYDLLELAEEDISAHADSHGFDDAVAREIRAFLRGDDPPVLAGEHVSDDVPEAIIDALNEQALKERKHRETVRKVDG